MQAVRKLFEMGCQLVVLGCNTASAKALRTIQQRDLPFLDVNRRVLGVIRPTVESVGMLTKTRHIGILATEGTIKSESYPMEIKKLFPDVVVTGQACPMWVPLVENHEYDEPGADYFVRKSINKLLSLDSSIDTVILGCTHFPLLLPKIRQFLPAHITILPQGELVAASLENYLFRHPDMDARCTKGGTCRYYTTESTSKFSDSASIFMNQPLQASHIEL